MPPLPTFAPVDCRFLRRYEYGRTPFDRIPLADQTYLRDIRARLQALARVAADEYRGHVELTDFVSPLNPGGRVTGTYWAGVYPRIVGDERTQKSSHLQLAVGITPDGFVISFGRASGTSIRALPDKRTPLQRQINLVKKNLANLRVPLVAHVERTLPSYWTFRKQGIATDKKNDFASLAQWLEHAASDAGARATISMFIRVEEIEKDRFDVGANFLEANRLFEPLFEAVYGTEEMAQIVSAVEPVAHGENDEPADRDLVVMTDEFSSALRRAHLSLGANHDDDVRAFVASLITKRFVILTGLSGSGKTQLSLRFGDWIGHDRTLVTPVRPDWTGAEALFGYEDALQPVRDGARAWHVPDALAFLLRAANDPHHPYLLVLDEMNLAHVERYFADFLSGLETGQPCLPNLEYGDDGQYRIPLGAEPKLPIPTNLFVIGTVNIDETTYLFSPKVLDRANTLDFRVRTEDLQTDYHKPESCPSGSPRLVRGILEISRDERFQHQNPAPGRDEFTAGLRRVHEILSEFNLEFGHRVFYEATRFAAIFAATSLKDPHAALDRQILQKILPRLHGSRRKLELALCALGAECLPFTGENGREAETTRFDPLAHPAQAARMPLSFAKIQRMVRALRLNQFTSFSE